jgi:hypothetical protein
MPSLVPDYLDAADYVLTAALRLLSAERHLDRKRDAHTVAEAEYARELLARAARTLTHATDALPPGYQPVGWSKHSKRSRS